MAETLGFYPSGYFLPSACLCGCILSTTGLENPYSDQIYRTVAFVFMLCQIVVMFLGQSYQDILKRGYYIEFTKTAKHVLMVMLLSVLYLFATQQAVSYSRLTLFHTAFCIYALTTSAGYGTKNMS